MSTFFKQNFGFIRPKKQFFFSLLSLLFVGCLVLCSACSDTVDYFTYVSELRSNIFLCSTDSFTLRILAVKKESPYVSDGIPLETCERTEVFLIGPSGDREYDISFTVEGKTYGGDMSYDNVKAEYYYSCTLDVSELSEISCTLVCGEESTQLTALSVRKENTLTPRESLSAVETAEPELFSSMTDKYGFSGEIYLRLIYEDAPYYYVGIIDRNGNTTAFLLNGETGKILAKRQS